MWFGMPSVSRVSVNRIVALGRALAGLLAGALLIFDLLAANSGFHQALHQQDKAGSTNCVLCLLAKGQVDLPQSVPAAASPVWSSFALVPLAEPTAMVDFTYLIAPSRAPPAFASPLSVVA